MNDKDKLKLIESFSRHWCARKVHENFPGKTTIDNFLHRYSGELEEWIIPAVEEWIKHEKGNSKKK